MVTVNGASGVNAAKLVAEDNKQESENATNRSRQKEERNVMSLDQVKKLRNATQILVDVSRLFYGILMKTQRSSTNMFRVFLSFTTCRTTIENIGVQNISSV